MSEPRSIHAAEDWGVVLQSVPSKNKKGIVKRLEEIFELDKRDAEQILSNMPLILVDNLSFGLAARIKKFFQTLGAVAETTNHDMIKKNCFQVLWPQTPDLSFFMKHETGPVEASAQEQKSSAKGTKVSTTEKNVASREMKQQMPKIHEASLPEKPAQASPAIVPHSPTVPTQGSSEAVSQPYAVPEEKSPEGSSTGIDSEWERRAKELNGKLRKFHEEKQELQAQHAETTEKVKNEFQQRLEEEKKKSGEAAKAYEDLQKEAKKHEALSREGEDWRSKAAALSEKVRELETNLMQKTSAVEHMVQQIEDEKKKNCESAKVCEDLQREIQKYEALAREGDDWRSKATALSERVRELESNLMQKTSAVEQLIQQKDDLSHQSEKAAEETRRELSNLRSREQEFSKKIEGLERSIEEMTESLRSRDGALAQFEKQIAELSEKAQGYESLCQEHEQLVSERATIRQEYDAKFASQEARLAKDEEDHRRYRSRTDRKNAAAARELGEWIRGIDTIRQGLQKLILFLGSESAVLDSEKKSNLRSPLTRGPDVSNSGKS